MTGVNVPVMRASTPRASKIHDFQLAASLGPQLALMNERHIIDKARVTGSAKRNRAYRTEDLQQSAYDLADEIDALHSSLDWDEVTASRSARQSTEPVGISVLRESIAAAVAGSDDSDDEEDAEEEKEEQTKDDTVRACAGSMVLEELASGSPRTPKQRSTMSRDGYFVSDEYSRALEASEKARERLRSPFMSKQKPVVTVAERAFAGTVYEGKSMRASPRQTRTYYEKMVASQRPVVRKEEVFEPRHVKVKVKVERDRTVILPDPPNLTLSCTAVCGVIGAEIDGILREVESSL